MCCASDLCAQGPDEEQPSNSPDSSVSLNSPIAPAIAYTPLDVEQKYLYSLNEMASPARWIGFAVHAAFDQAQKSPGVWGNGPDSYGFRVANAFGRSLLRTNIAFCVRAFDREDPRYFRLASGTAWKRVRYALTAQS
jgi:hypothetical protein